MKTKLDLKQHETILKKYSLFAVYQPNI